MPSRAASPWPLLLSALRRAPRPRLCAAELASQGIDVEQLLQAALLRRAPADQYRPRECEHDCLPNLDLESREAEGLVGVACPEEPACWPGWMWVAARELDLFEVVPAELIEALRRHNGLSTLIRAPPTPALPLGLLERRGLRLPVIWMPSLPPPGDLVARAIAGDLGADGAVVVVGRAQGHGLPRVLPGSRIVLIDGGDATGGDLELHRALDLLDPGYRGRRTADPLALFDEVHLRFAHVAGVRHVVELNGVELASFARSDQRFLRLLYLAAVRAHELDVDGGGWTKKSRVEISSDNEHELSKLRSALKDTPHPLLSDDERGALIKSSPAQDGCIRLAVLPHRIDFDDSLRAFDYLSERSTAPRSPKTRVTQGARDLAKHQVSARAVSEALLEAARQLGVPGGGTPPPK